MQNKPNESDTQLLSLPIRLLPNQPTITLDEFQTWSARRLPPAIPSFDDLEPQRICVGLTRDLPLHRRDGYIYSPAYEPVYLTPNTRSSSYSLIQAGGEALPLSDVLLQPDFTDHKTCLFVARNSLLDYQTRLTAAVGAYHARLGDWRAQRREWEAALLVALGKHTAEEMASLVRSELTKDKYRPWFVGGSDQAEYTSPHCLRDGPVAFALRRRLDHIARTISTMTDQLLELSVAGAYYADRFDMEYELCDENPRLDQELFPDWAVERSMHWQLAARTGLIADAAGLVDGAFRAGWLDKHPWGLPAYEFQREIQRAGRSINELFSAEMSDLLYGVEEWYFSALDERERAIVQGVRMRWWPMPWELYRNVGGCFLGLGIHLGLSDLGMGSTYYPLGIRWENKPAV